jgi:hypothetical protein
MPTRFSIVHELKKSRWREPQQSLLFELAVKVNKIDYLIVQINSYAERCGMPFVGLRYSKE